MARRVLVLVGVVINAMVLLLMLHQVADQASENDIVLISEIAWAGTVASPFDQWIELYNPAAGAVDISGWRLVSEGNFTVTLQGIISGQGFYLLEQGNDLTVADQQADQMYRGLLSRDGGRLLLLRVDGSSADTANETGGAWPAGTVDPDYRSAERARPEPLDDWQDNDGLTRNGIDAEGNPLNGTPGRLNSSWSGHEEQANLFLNKDGPTTVDPQATFTYVLTISNSGTATATAVVLTDTLPGAVHHVASLPTATWREDAPWLLSWQLPDMAPFSQSTVVITVNLKAGVTAPFTNSASISSATSELNTEDNRASIVTEVDGDNSAAVLLNAVHFDGYAPLDLDEAVQLVNLGPAVADLSGWQLTDRVSIVTLPEGVLLAPDARLWLARHATAFNAYFGHPPGLETDASDAQVPEMDGSWPRLANTGDAVLLFDATGGLRDALVYGQGDVGDSEWIGPPLQPYSGNRQFASEGQILYRKFNMYEAMPVLDTNQAADWAQDPDDALAGRRARYPGWNPEAFYPPVTITETAKLTVAIAPDNTFKALQAAVNAASQRIEIQSHTFRSLAIAELLVAALDRGVSVTILLEGDPVGGIAPEQDNACQLVETHGGQCWYMINDETSGAFDRYRYLHAKYILLDRRQVMISSENLSPDSFPFTEGTDSLAGRRGVMLWTDAAHIVRQVIEIWDADFDPEHHADLARWNYESTSSTTAVTVPAVADAAGDYALRFPSPLTWYDQFEFQLIQGPETSLHAASGALDLISRAGPGDEILIQQLSERRYWGDSAAEPGQNPRLEALLAAARRGARVRLLLDSFFDTSSSVMGNRATCIDLMEAAAAEKLDLYCAIANPTGLGLHNKMILARIDGRGFVMAGSLNGTELSHKGNRELALIVQSDEAHQLLAEMFQADWTYHQLFPLVMRNYHGPANHLLISEVLYDPTGPDDAEFIELVNPTPETVHLDGYLLGDAVRADDFEDMRARRARPGARAARLADPGRGCSSTG